MWGVSRRTCGEGEAGTAWWRGALEVAEAITGASPGVGVAFPTGFSLCRTNHLAPLLAVRREEVESPGNDGS